eukprot:TRINITY_DN13025_c0_g1_i2.p2 TRINITY_DN13025_c0_g1~~TRINITY_DN13025_c0_g1_i2.p2  ORF type:complete len:138 (-),score=23.08 TRINITY_DN13025_c0_g1_i2:1604-2017(-)
MRLVRHVASVLPLVGCAAAAEVLGFKANPPDVPSQNEDLVIEHLWQFSMDDPPVKLAFVPGTDGMVVTAHKTGFMRLYQNVDADVNDYKVCIDMHFLCTPLQHEMPFQMVTGSRGGSEDVLCVHSPLELCILIAVRT